MDKLQALYDKWKALQPLNERKQFLLSQRFTVEYNYNSNHIEGNTLTSNRAFVAVWKGKRRRQAERLCGHESQFGKRKDARR